MKTFFLTIIIVFLFLVQNMVGQSYISVQGSFNYWQHTELFGPGIGFGYQYKKENLGFSVQYDFGYGTLNRLNSFDNVDYNNWSTVMVETEKGEWAQYLCCHSLKDIYELPGTTDYGKQHQLTIQLGYNFFTKNNLSLVAKMGGYSAIVEQFFTFKNLPLYYIDLSPFYRGPLNYIPSTSQKILTLGANLEFALDYTKGHRIWSPYLSLGIGPKYSSYASVGLRLSTQLIKK